MTVVLEPDLIQLNILLRGERCTCPELEHLRCERLSTIMYLQLIGLLNKSAKCGNCNDDMKLKRRVDCDDMYSWRCPKDCKQARCSVRYGSIFQNSNLSLCIIMHLFHAFSNDIPAYLTERQLQNQVAQCAVLECYEKLRSFMSNKLIESPNRFFGEEISLHVCSIIRFITLLAALHYYIIITLLL
jgi:hypothetical protein